MGFPMKIRFKLNFWQSVDFPDMEEGTDVSVYFKVPWENLGFPEQFGYHPSFPWGWAQREAEITWGEALRVNLRSFYTVGQFISVQ